MIDFSQFTDAEILAMRERVIKTVKLLSKYKDVEKPKLPKKEKKKPNTHK